MKFIFSKLPNDIINKILLYDEHFIMRKGNIISIIAKSDYRYNLLKLIVCTEYSYENYNNKLICTYNLPNLYNYEGRSNTFSDAIFVYIKEHSDFIAYDIWIGRQYPKHIICNKKQYYHIENKLEYNWNYTEFEYIRR
jgi:hypothetical protein